MLYLIWELNFNQKNNDKLNHMGNTIRIIKGRRSGDHVQAKI